MSEHERGLDLDAAVSRLEDVLLALPFDRALPDLSELLDRSGVPPELLRRDERALKVLHEAVLARPLAQHHEVQQLRTEVELLTLEVEVLTDRMLAAGTDTSTLAAAGDRLDEVRHRLEELRDRL